MEAPDKIYVYIPDDDIVGTASTQKGFPHQFVNTRYVRKDAFIEKMFNFLSEKYLIKTKEPLRWVSIRQVIEDFKKYMED